MTNRTATARKSSASTVAAAARKSFLITSRDQLVFVANRTGGFPGIDAEIAALNKQIAACK